MKITVAILFLFLSATIYAQSIGGTSGLLHIPTADFMSDKEIWFGTSIYNKKHLLYSDNEYYMIAPYITIAYLPFLEVSARINRKLNYNDYSSHSWDRMPTVRIRIIREKEYLPAIVFGMQDFLTSTDLITNHFNATYLAASKYFQFWSPKKNLGIHTGYSIKLIKAIDYQFKGLFGGLNYMPFDFLQFIAEYDSFKINCGLKLLLFKHLQLSTALENFDAFTVNANLKFDLP